MANLQSISVRTEGRDQWIEITREVRALVSDAKIESGMVVVYVPHTTAGITINENADPDVVRDLIQQLDVMVPWRQPFYRHGEGNTAAHLKAAMMGTSVTVLIERGEMVLGTWQGIWFCEFDGPRTRTVHVKVVA